MLPRPARRRSGLTLAEVIIAVAIFLFALVAIGSLITSSAQQAKFVNDKSLAARFCQSKMAEFQSGAQDLSSVNEQPIDDDDPGLVWSATVDDAPDGPTGLFLVEITVLREQPDGGKVTVGKLTKLVLDPTRFGSTQDTPPSGG